MRAPLDLVAQNTLTTEKLFSQWQKLFSQRKKNGKRGCAATRPGVARERLAVVADQAAMLPQHQRVFRKTTGKFASLGAHFVAAHGLGGIRVQSRHARKGRARMGDEVSQILRFFLSALICLACTTASAAAE